MVRCGTASYGMAWHDTAWHGIVCIILLIMSIMNNINKNAGKKVGQVRNLYRKYGCGGKNLLKASETN